VSEILRMNTEILCRDDATLRDVDFKQRLITVLAVPWEQEAKILWRGEQWNEVFLRSAFDGLEDHAGRVPVNRNHNKEDTVGKVVQIDTKDPQGMVAVFKIAKIPRGDEALALAEEDMIGPSIGYFVKEPSDAEVIRKRMLRRVKRAFLDHISLVETPAFEGAKVLAVREGSSWPEPVETPLPETPTLDEFMNDDVLEWARRRASSG
jgi:HK97 family phage prohead protease